jgi:hypothetical protein
LSVFEGRRLSLYRGGGRGREMAGKGGGGEGRAEEWRPRRLVEKQDKKKGNGGI